MAKAQHRTPEYRRAKAEFGAVIKRGDGWCVEPICLMPSRYIEPSTPTRQWDVCHDITGTFITGPGHAKCNRSEGATRGNKARRTVATATHWPL